MPKNFDVHARKRLLRADINARSLLKREEFGTECLLLALVDPHSKVSNELNSCGLGYERVFNCICHLVGVGETLYMTPRPSNMAVKRVLACAEIRATDQCHREITTLDLAIALFEQDRGIVHTVTDTLCNIDQSDLVAFLRHQERELPKIDSENRELLFHGLDRLLTASAAAWQEPSGLD